MSVLVKGMEMPECCGYCPFEYKNYCMAKPSLKVERTNRHPHCPLVPAADVRSVVLCKDCVYSNKWYADRLICYLWNDHDGNAVFEDGFCNYGFKREES